MPTNSVLSVFVFAFAVSFGAVVSPGPVSAAIVTESPRQGWQVGPLVATAHIALEAIVVVLLGLGLSRGMASPAMQRAIALGGGALLIFLGASYLWGVWRGGIQLPQAQAGAAPRSTASLLGLGALTTLSNPFWYAWWVTVAAGFLAQARGLGVVGPVAFYLGHISADYAWDTVLAVATSAGGRWLTDGRYRLLILLTGGFMVYLGVVFVQTGLGLQGPLG